MGFQPAPLDVSNPPREGARTNLVLAVDCPKAPGSVSCYQILLDESAALIFAPVDRDDTVADCDDLALAIEGGAAHVELKPGGCDARAASARERLQRLKLSRAKGSARVSDLHARRDEAERVQEAAEAEAVAKAAAAEEAAAAILAEVASESGDDARAASRA